MESSLISIIMPIYNNRNFMDEAIRSIEHLNECEYEVIAIVRDEGDGVYDYLKDHYSSNRFKVILQEDKGYSNAINIGYRLARGKYIAFQDADDISATGRFSLELGALENNPTAEMVYSRANTIDQNGRVRSVFGGLSVGGIIPKKKAFTELYVHRNFIPNPTVMMRRRHISGDTLFDERIEYSNDYLHHMLLSKDWDIVQIDEPMVGIRRFSGHLNATSKLDENLTALEWISSYVGKIGLEQGIVNERDCHIALSNIYLFMAFRYFQDKRYKDAFSCYIRSMNQLQFPLDNLTFRMSMLVKALSNIRK